jgi:polar amino acid transport system permease protein
MLHTMIVSLPFLGSGLVVTLEVSVLVVVTSLIGGLVLGTGLTWGPLGLRLVIRLLVDVVRGVPVLVLIFAVYYVSPVIGLKFGNFTAAVAALSLFSTAQVTEIVRGAASSIHHGQLEAGRSIGLTFPGVLFFVIFPQALRRFLPPWINSVADAVKGSALVSLIGVVDLMLSIQQVIGRTYRPLPLYVLGAIIYFAINYTLSSLSRGLEARFAYVRD